MLSLGLDIGTTSIGFAVIDEYGNTVDSGSFTHNAFIETGNSWEKIQDTDRLLRLALEVAEKEAEKYDLSCIGITGQQHGILYLDSDGNSVSPLYTWQDARALQRENGKTYLERIKELCGGSLSAGYGLASHFYNIKNSLVPENAVSLATVADTFAMHLAGNKRPLTEASNAHSLGMFDIEANAFDVAAVSDCGMDVSMLPKLCPGRLIGTYRGIPVAAAIGDNQASFIGATGGKEDVILVNVGTGSQISMRSDKPVGFSCTEVRPYPLGGYLLSGSSLCGGRAWALTERFFAQTLKAFTGIDAPVYELLSELVNNTADNGTYPEVCTCFDGTRSDPEKRGSIRNISVDNFTPGQFALGILHGMADELYEIYRSCLDEGLAAKSQLIGSGNGLRLNAHLRRVTAQKFNMELEMSKTLEEASVGAALFALSAIRPSPTRIQQR